MDAAYATAYAILPDRHILLEALKR